MELKVPITVEDEVCFSSKYSLMASISHSGTQNQGHYWTVVNDLNSGDWLSCNGRVVLKLPQHSGNNTTSYILFYKTISASLILCKGVLLFLTFIVFGCDNPTYYPSPGREIEFAHRSSGIYIPARPQFSWEALEKRLASLG